MNSAPPNRNLFRFRVASENAFSELADGQGWFSRYDCLNDPFEGSYINQTTDRAFDELIRSFRVLCFSAVNDNLLLWAHYADNHRGFCLEYTFSDKAFREQCIPVNYSAAQHVLEKVERYPADFHIGAARGHLSVNINNEGKVFRTKSNDWSYEEEYRLVRVAKKPEEHGERWPIPAVLTGVYFGMRASESVIGIVERLLHDKRSVNFCKAVLVPGEFRLRFEPLVRAEI